MDYIRKFHYYNMWGIHNVCWDDIRDDINILVGNNGSGKTTFLNAIYDYYTKYQASSHKISVRSAVEATDTAIPLAFIRSFDVPSNVRKNTNSPLYEELLKVVYQNRERQSLFDYRMRALNFREEAQRVESRIKTLFVTIDSFFNSTGKRVDFDREANKLVFYTGNGKTVSLGQLSAGEKQLLLILITVFLMDGKQYVLLMDEPELSLHIEWQEKLIGAIRDLNPRCQIILTTHSPSIFAAGWENCLTFIEDLYQDAKVLR